MSIKEIAVAEGMLTSEQFDELVSPEAVCRLGSPMVSRKDQDGSSHT